MASPPSRKGALRYSQVVDVLVEEMTASRESVPEPLSEKMYSERFMVRIWFANWDVFRDDLSPLDPRKYITP